MAFVQFMYGRYTVLYVTNKRHIDNVHVVAIGDTNGQKNSMCKHVSMAVRAGVCLSVCVCVCVCLCFLSFVNI